MALPYSMNPALRFWLWSDRDRYNEFRALAPVGRLQAHLSKQDRVVLTLDSLQPDVGREVLWGLPDSLSNEVLLAHSLLSATRMELKALLSAVHQALPVPIRGILSDDRVTIRTVVAPLLYRTSRVDR